MRFEWFCTGALALVAWPCALVRVCRAWKRVRHWALDDDLLLDALLVTLGSVLGAVLSPLHPPASAGA